MWIQYKMKIQFLKSTKKAIIEDYPEDTYIVYYPGYELPEINNIKYMEFSEFRNRYFEIHSNKLIFIGLNRMITPSNRYDLVNDYIQILSPNIPKMSIDTNPFIGEPWRVFYHYSIVHNIFMKVNYSNPIEGKWLKWFYRETNFCELAGDNIKLLIKDTYSDLDQLITKFKFYEPNDMDIEYYAEVKKFVFEKYNTPKLLINNILKQCNKHFQIDFNYDSYLTNKEFLFPDLKIYQFMVEENRRRMDIYNAVIHEGYKSK